MPRGDAVGNVRFAVWLTGGDGRRPMAETALGAIMTLPAYPLGFPYLHSARNDFRFASVGDEPNGVSLSVISALTRLDVDPCLGDGDRLAPLVTAAGPFF